MRSYLDILAQIVAEGKDKPTRTGVETLSVSGVIFEHDMATGFPLITTKYVPLKVVAVELEGFLQGITDKNWYKARGCHIWDHWANPRMTWVEDEGLRKARQLQEQDLGPIYGFCWRRFGHPYRDGNPYNRPFSDYSAGLVKRTLTNGGIDQLANVVRTLKENPLDRRMIVTAWHPKYLPQQALPPCHYGWQVLSDGRTLDLIWNQRSVDTPLGLPFNIASYGLLLLLLAHEVNMVPGRLVGFLADTHIYENQVDGCLEQLDREPWPLCTVNLTHGGRGGSILDWTHTEWTYGQSYSHDARIAFPLAV